MNILISIYITGMLYLLYNRKEKFKKEDILVIIIWPILILLILYIYFTNKDLFLELIKEYTRKR